MAASALEVLPFEYGLLPVRIILYLAKKRSNSCLNSDPKSAFISDGIGCDERYVNICFLTVTANRLVDGYTMMYPVHASTNTSALL